MDEKLNIEKIVLEAAEIPGWMTLKELFWLAKKASSLPMWSHWAELGSYCGRSLLAVGLALPAGSTLVSVDRNWQNREDHPVNLFDVLQRINAVRGDEIKICAICDTTDNANVLLLESRFDVVFIDANHSHESCYKDIVNWSLLLKPEGTICGHDYSDSWPGVQKSVDELLPGSEITGSIWHHQYSI